MQLYWCNYSGLKASDSHSKWKLRVRLSNDKLGILNARKKAIDKEDERKMEGSYWLKRIVVKDYGAKMMGQL